MKILVWDTVSILLVALPFTWHDHFISKKHPFFLQTRLSASTYHISTSCSLITVAIVLHVDDFVPPKSVPLRLAHDSLHCIQRHLLKWKL